MGLFSSVVKHSSGNMFSVLLTVFGVNFEFYFLHSHMEHAYHNEIGSLVLMLSFFHQSSALEHNALMLFPTF